MSSQPRPAYYTLSTTDGHQATIYVAPDDDPWQAATYFARASFASDSQLAELRIASQAEIAALTAHLGGAQLASAPPPEPGSGTAPPDKALPVIDQPPRGAKVNVDRLGRKPSDHPTWANHRQQETWRTGVLVVWDHLLQRVVGLRAGEAAGLLAFMRADAAWQTEGIQVGPTDNFSPLDDPHWEPEAVTRDAIPLDAADALQLFDSLQRNQQALHQLAQDEQRQARHALSRAYGVLLDAATRTQARRAQQEDAAQAEPQSHAPPADSPEAA